MRSRSNAFLALLAGSLLIGTAACSGSDSQVSRSPAPTASETPLPLPSEAPASPDPEPPAAAPASHAAAPSDPYKLAIDKADSAQNISQSAQSQDDWNLVVSRWQQAIQLMKSVPSSSPYRALVQSKLTEYQRSLAFAQKQVARANSNEAALDAGALLDNAPVSTVTTTKPEVITSANNTPSPGSGRIFRARIKRREGGTPVIDVMFNGNHTYEMIVDTGASGTVITAEMASEMGLRMIGKAKVDTASDRDVEVPLAFVNSISVGGAVAKGVVVAIGNSALDVGLLGHDFFGDYDVTVRRDVVEFRQR